MSWSRTLAIGALAAVLVAWLWFTRQDGATNSGTIVGPTTVDETSTAPTLEQSQEAESDRHPADTKVSSSPIQIVGPDGAPISGAVVSWRALSSLHSSPPHDWPWLDETAWRATTIVRKTDTLGRVTLGGPELASASGGAVWVTKAGFRAWSRLLNAGEDQSAIPRTIALVAAAPLDVRVVDSSGLPVIGALVVQRFALAESARVELGPDVVRMQCALARFAVTDEAGEVLLPDLGGRQVIDAATGTLRSAPWYGVAPARVELEVLPCFSWGGRVVGASRGAHSGDERVEVFAVGGGTKTRIDAGIVRRDGSFGPRTIATTRSALVEFELVGGTVVPTSVRRASPAAGDHIEVELTALTGFEFPVIVTAESGIPLRGAAVTWSWSTEDRTQRFVRSTGADGIAVLPAGSAGPIVLQVERKGFESRQFHLSLSSDVSPPYPVVLNAGGSVIGRVHHAGEPIENFTIVHRSVNRPETLAAAEFADSKDGTFEIDGLPIGEVALFAMSHELPRSAEQRVAVSLHSRPELEFNLDSGAVGRGIVRDAATGEPIPGARVQVWTVEGQTRIREFGQSAVTDSSGRFEVGGLASGESNLLDARAEGYAASEKLVRGVGNSIQDVGVLALQLPRSLTVRLELGPESDATEWSATVFATRPLARRVFPSSGVLEFDNLAIGGCHVTIERGTAEAETKFVVVTPDADAEVSFSLNSGTSFEVELVTGSLDVDLASCWLLVRGFAAGYELSGYRYLAVPSSGLIQVSRIQQDRLFLAVVSSDGAQLGSRRLGQQDVSSGRVRLELGPQLHTIRIVDTNRQPCVGWAVSSGQRSTGWLQTAFTDSNGDAEFEGFKNESIDLHIQLTPSGGGVLRDVLLREEITEVVLDVRAALAVRLLDGAEALSGVPIWLQDGFGAHAPFATMTTDQDGFARSDRHLAQEFRAEVRQTGLWPARFILNAANPPVEQAVQVRRRGSVVLHARRDGLPLAGVTLAVESVEFATSASTWIADGAITASHSGCVTDGQGRLRLDGLPRGPYRWSVTLDDGVQIGGNFDVEPQRRVDVDLAIP